ncbi:MAG: hypothetical protein U0929_01345 [Planctomycetaceae bacterium]
MVRYLLALLFVLIPVSVRAQTSYPMLMSLKPVAAQVGKSSEHTLSSAYSMFGARQVIVSGTGVTGEVLTKMEKDKDGKSPNLQSIQLKFTIAPDALPGVRDFRIISDAGASTIGQLVVVTDPVIVEQDNNDTRDTAQPVSLPAALCGTIEKGEDVDLFKFQVTEPTTLNFHVLAMRLEDKIHDLQTHVDPIITVRTASGSTVAAADNRYAADPLLKCRIEHPGEYLLEIRDVRYEGNAHWVYCVEALNRPFVTTVHPLGVEPGSTAEIRLNGWEPAESAKISWAVPSDLPPGLLFRPLSVPTGATNPVSVVVNDLPPVHEIAEDNNSPATAQMVSIPSGISGCIETESDIDCYTFEAKAGDLIGLDVISRRAGAQLDPMVSILNAQGGRLLENDDQSAGAISSQDALVDSWQAPADGKYSIEIRDLHLRGGADFVYFIKLFRPEPKFQLILDSDKTPLVPGGSTPLFVRVQRKNGFDGEVQLGIEGLPPGVTATCGRILPGASIDGMILLTADPTAVPVAANVRVTGRGTIKVKDQTRELVVQAIPMQENYMPGGGRNHWPMLMHTVSVAPLSDLLSVKATPADIVLKPGESKTIDIDVVRAPGFEQNITLDMVYQHLGGIFANTLPPGVKIDAKASKTLLTAKETKGSIVLTAEPTSAPVDKQLTTVMGHVSINFVMKSATCSPPVWVTVSQP